MSHATKAGLGTVFIHDGGYDGDVDVISVSWPEKITQPDGTERWSVSVPFADLREFVFAYLRQRKIDQLEQLDDEGFEGMLLGPTGNHLTSG